MRSIKILFLSLAALAVLVLSCDKVKDNPVYGAGTSPVLTASTTAIAPPASDSNKIVLRLDWTNANHATGHIKYTVEIDSTGKNFKNEVIKEVTDSLYTTFLAKELNSILLGFGYAFNVPVDMDVRVTSSYLNNNERLSSNVIKIRMTPYVIPPKVPIPTSGKLFIVGDATAGGWNNPVPVPSQELARLDNTTWGGVFQLTGGKQYLLLPVNGDWSHKFSVANNSLTGLSAGGDFGFDLSDNFPGPATTGLYKIIVDFQQGKFTVTAYTGGILPTNLYLVGDATAGGWNNPVPIPSQQFTRQNSSVWTITIPLIGGKQYLMLPVNGDWSHKFAVANNTIAGLWQGGAFGYDLSDNFPGPPTSATYTITANFVTNKFSVQ